MTDFSADLGPNARAYAALISGPAFAAAPGPLRERILDHAPSIGSPIVHFVALTELVYANREGLAPELLRFGAGCAYLCRVHRWHGLGEGRGWQIQQALQRAAGDAPPQGSPWAAPANDPAPADGFFIPAA